MGTIGERLENPLELLKEKSVYVKAWQRPCATSFLISMQFRVLAGFMRLGIYKYTKADKSNKKSFIQQVKSCPNK